jgi:hypothetical protein
MLAIAAAGFLPASDARAAGNGTKDAQDLRREVSRLRAEVQALQSAIAETTELERQRDANLVRALKDDTSAAAAPSPSPSPSPLDAPAAGNDTADEAREAAPVPPATHAPAAGAAGGDKGRAVARRHRHKHAGRSRAKATRVLTDEK